MTAVMKHNANDCTSKRISRPKPTSELLVGIFILGNEENTNEKE